MRRALALATLISITACSHTPTRAPAHAAATPVYSLSKFNWIHVDYQTFQRHAEPPPFRAGARLADNDIVVKRLQAWADRIHALVEADYRAENGGAPFTTPKPKIVVVPAKTAQAWAAGLPVCFKIPTRVAGAGNGQKISGHIHLEGDRYYERRANPFKPRPVTCISSKDDVREFAVWFNSLGGKCQLFLEGGELVIRGTVCAPRHGGVIAEAGGVEFYSVSNYIHFTSQMIAISETEEGAVGTLAHELGHYYRTHTIQDLIGMKYAFWYQQEHPPRAGLPLKLANSEEYNRTRERLLPYPFPIVEGRKFGYVLREFLVSHLRAPLKEACGETCACKDAVNMVHRPWTSDFVGFGHSVPKASRAAYLAYEEELLKCSASVTLADTAPFREAFEDSRAAKYISEFPVENNLLALLEALNDKAMEVDRELREFEAHLIKDRVGYYTSEQEADDFAVEYSSKLGLNPMNVNLEKFRQYRADPDFDEDEFRARSGGLSYERCLLLRNSGWSEPVPIGSLTDIHHGPCFRLYNMDQEVKAHGWSQATTPKPSFKESWTQVLRRAREVTPRADTPVPEALQFPVWPSGEPQPSGLIIN